MDHERGDSKAPEPAGSTASAEDRQELPRHAAPVGGALDDLAKVVAHVVLFEEVGAADEPADLDEALELRLGVRWHGS